MFTRIGRFFKAIFNAILGEAEAQVPLALLDEAVREMLDSLRGLRENLGDAGRILAVFEPRSNTMKRGVLKGELPASLGDADAVFCFSAGLAWDVAGLLGGLPMPVTVLATVRLEALASAATTFLVPVPAMAPSMPAASAKALRRRPRRSGRVSAPQ